MIVQAVAYGRGIASRCCGVDAGASEVGIVGEKPRRLCRVGRPPAGIRQAGQHEERVFTGAGGGGGFQTSGAIASRCALSFVQVANPYERAIASCASTSFNGSSCGGGCG